MYSSSLICCLRWLFYYLISFILFLFFYFWNIIIIYRISLRLDLIKIQIHSWSLIIYDLLFIIIQLHIWKFLNLKLVTWVQVSNWWDGYKFVGLGWVQCCWDGKWWSWNCLITDSFKINTFEIFVISYRINIFQPNTILRLHLCQLINQILYWIIISLWIFEISIEDFFHDLGCVFSSEHFFAEC